MSTDLCSLSVYCNVIENIRTMLWYIIHAFGYQIKHTTSIFIFISIASCLEGNGYFAVWYKKEKNCKISCLQDLLFWR